MGGKGTLKILFWVDSTQLLLFNDYHLMQLTIQKIHI